VWNDSGGITLKHFSYYYALVMISDARLFLIKSRVYTVSSVYSHRKNAYRRNETLELAKGLEPPTV
jgi:hypothetical protein